MKILFITPYPPGKAPSQRFRFEQYLKHLRARGTEVTFRSFLSSKAYSRFYSKGKNIQKFLDLQLGLLKRILLLFEISSYDYVFIHREMAPFGPPVFEWIVTRILRSTVIYDFDDAIWMADQEVSFWKRLVKLYSKTSTICRLSNQVVCSNTYLKSYAEKHNSNVHLIPTTIDIHYHKPILIFKSYRKSKTVIGWTGSHSTLKYLDNIHLILDPIAEVYPIEFLVICNQKPKFDLPYLYFKNWQLESEIPDLLSIDIGLMPLPDQEWTRGKGGFKVLQYMALEIPPVASPVGVNSEIIEQNVDGFLCDTPEEWQEKIILLIENPSMRQIIGTAGRQKVCQFYSVQANLTKFTSLFGSGKVIKDPNQQ